MKHQSALVFLSLSFALVLSAGCGKGKQNGDEEGSGTPVKAVVSVRIAPIATGDALVSVTAIGKTGATRREKLFSPTAGKIISLKVLEGSTVHAGDVVAVIVTKESQAAISGAGVLLRSATTDEQKQEAERALQLARSSQSTVAVSARFDGVIASRNVGEGELVSENTELLTVIDLSSTVFLADVTLNDVPRVHKGMVAGVRFQSFPEKEYKAIVDALLPQSDAQSQTVQVRLRFTELTPALRALLRTEMTGTARIITDIRKHVLFVPSSAVLRDDENNAYSVVTVTADSLAKIIPVIVGVTTDSTVEVQSDLLKEGMPVITKGNYSLPDSTKVAVGQREGQ